MSPNKSFCILAWKHLHITTRGFRSLCCDSDEWVLNFGPLEAEEYQKNLVPQELKSVRKQMLEGGKIEACSRCYRSEESGLQSSRQYFNDLFRDESKKVLASLDVDTSDIISIDFRGDNRCNFLCRTCNPMYSSALDFEARRFFSDYKKTEYKKINLFNFSQYQDFSKVRRIYFAGGEPLMSENHLEFLRHLIANDFKNIELVYTTNGSVIRKNNFEILSIWEKFDKVVLGVSLDSWGDRAEYIRHGTNWPQLIRDLLFCKKKLKNSYLFASITISVFNVLTLPQFIKELVATGLVRYKDMHLHLVYQPEEFNMNNFGSEFRKLAIDQLKSLLPFFVSAKEPRLVAAVNGLIAHLDPTREKNLRNEFFSKIERFDKIRGQSFENVFPEIMSALNSETI